MWTGMKMECFLSTNKPSEVFMWLAGNSNSKEVFVWQDGNKNNVLDGLGNKVVPRDKIDF